MERDFGVILVALSGVLLSSVSVLLKLGAWSIDVIQVVWLSGIGRFITTFFLSKKDDSVCVLPSLLGWISFSFSALAFASLDLGTATALVRCGWNDSSLDNLCSLLGILLVFRPSRWVPYAAAIVASAIHAKSTHRHSLYDLIASPLVLLVAPSPVVKLVDLSPLAVAASIAAGVFDYLSRHCMQHASSILLMNDQQMQKQKHIARAIDVAAAFAWQHLFFQHVMGSVHYVTPPPDARTFFGIALIAVGPLLLLLLRHFSRQPQRPPPQKGEEEGSLIITM